MPKKYKGFVDRTSKLLKNLGVTIELESFNSDSIVGVSTFNIVFKGVSNYSIKDSDILRVAKKHIKGVSDKESSSEVFLEFSVDTKTVDFNKVSDGMYYFIEDLEVNYDKNMG